MGAQHVNFLLQQTHNTSSSPPRSMPNCTRVNPDVRPCPQQGRPRLHRTPGSKGCAHAQCRCEELDPRTPSSRACVTHAWAACMGTVAWSMLRRTGPHTCWVCMRHHADACRHTPAPRPPVCCRSHGHRPARDVHRWVRAASGHLRNACTGVVQRARGGLAGSSRRPAASAYGRRDCV
jgi:hypothetical protein